MKNRILLAVALAAIIAANTGTAGTREDIKNAIITVTPIMGELCKALKDVAGAIASVVFIWAAVQWLSSRDDPGKRKKAQDTMIAVIIGIVIIGLSISLVDSVLTSMGLTKTTAGFC
jgi:hypothetical protein